MLIKIILILIVAGYLCIPDVVIATTRTMTGCSKEAFDVAYSDAVDGDTIEFPVCAGISTWSSALISKLNLTIKGQGYNNTIISAGGVIFNTHGETANGLRITGIGFTGGGYPDGVMYFEGSGKQGIKNVRIDHCKFSWSNASDSYRIVINVWDSAEGEIRGVFDNNYVENMYAFYLGWNRTSTKTYPQVVGSAQTGTENILFIEDNDIYVNNGCPAHLIVGNYTTRMVFRYNTVDYTGSDCGTYPDVIDAHDSYENWPSRGTFGYEIYENTFKMGGSTTRFMNLRGGQHIIFNNHISTNSPSWINIKTYNGTFAPSRCTGNTWDTEDASGSSCPDQINHSYFWGNKDNCGVDVTNCLSGNSSTPNNENPEYIILNTHYFTTQKPGYSEYTYPHPLRGEGTGCTISGASAAGATIK